MQTPVFCLYDELSPEALAQHAVWVYCHLTDYDQPWYDEVDDETFRALQNIDMPIGRSTAAIVSSSFHTAQGAHLTGFIENWGEPQGHPLLDYKPTIFGRGGKRVQLWHGATYQFGTKWLMESVANLSQLVNPSLAAHFPITFEIDERVFGCPVSGEFEGFGSFIANGKLGIHNLG